jgi:replicative DNA helicase
VSDPIFMPPIRNVASERAVIGSMLVYGSESIELACTELSGDHFSDSDCRMVFGAFKGIHSKTGGAASMSDVQAWIMHHENGRDMGYFLRENLNNASFDLSAHIEILRDDLLRAQIRRVALELLSRVHDHSLEARSLVTEAFTASDQLLRDETLDTSKGIGELAYRVADPNYHRVPIKTGFWDLDDFIGGFFKGELTVIGARPSVGKTAFLGNVAINVAHKDIPVVVMSHEMNAEAITQRLLCAKARVPYMAKTEGKLTTEQNQAMMAAAHEIAPLPIVFDDRTAPSISYVRKSVKKYVRETGASVVFVDYLTKVHSDNKNSTRERDVAEVSSALKDLSRELDVAVVVFSQLSRNSLQRVDGRPNVADLRDSGQIEQDADTIILMHRPGKDKKTWFGSDGENHTEFIVGKCRNGKTGIVELFFDGPNMTFKDVSGAKFLPIERQAQEPSPF